MSDVLQLEVVTPDREVVRESVTEVQVPGKAGYMGILPGHTPLLSELTTAALSYQKGAQRVYVAIFGGVVEVLDDRVTVLADGAERAEEIDVAKARETLAEAEKKFQTASSDPNAEWDAILQAAKQAYVRLEVAGHGDAHVNLTPETHR
jgi:F-type H+-transporting ATPase subunit epsilon